MTTAIAPTPPRRAPTFIERTLARLLAAAERAARAEETAAGPGLLQGLDPRVKVAGIFLLVLAGVVARSLAVVAGLFAVGVVLALLSGIPLGTLARRVWIGVFLFTGAIALPAVFLTPGEACGRLPLLGWTATEPGVRGAAFLVARGETAATLALLLVLATPWTQVLRALRAFGVPAVFVVVLEMTHRYLFLLLQTARDMFEARASRQVGVLAPADGRRLAAASAGVLLARSLQWSTEVHLAMLSRGFRGEVRTLDRFRWRGRDSLAAAGFAAIAALAVWWGR